MKNEADRYTTEMWQRHCGRMVELSWETASKRRAFRDGFNGEPKAHHHSARAFFDLGRHTRLLLGYSTGREEYNNPPAQALPA